MKKILSITLIIALGFIAVLSCKQDAPLTGLPSLPPHISVNSPGAVVANLGANLTAKVADGAGSPVASVQFDILNEAGTSVASKTFSEEFVPGDNDLKWTIAESKIDGMAAGNYKFQVKATDTDNNQSVTTVDLPILALRPECQVEGQVTVILISPEPAEKDTIGFVGSPTGWGGAPGTDIKMNKIVKGVYCASVTMDAGAEFKFRLNENWGTQEGKGDSGCSDGDNRVYSGDNMLIVETVPRWKPCN